ncbi:eCIS core domain-containing protein [Streptomyces brasiliensis]|uniref:eCIS core domain-containing protein n=1 Tax=Streptomyces brasiliensis TaxID=1954 RepID=UPI001E4796D6|nr:DUF4157 domain-containing protein [Streptomyces brasiliensis]
MADSSPAGQRALLDKAKASPSRPLPAPLIAAATSFFQNRNLSLARLHDNPVAQRATEAMGAQAMTIGAHIFAPPQAVGNMRLMGHELSHVNENLNGTHETGNTNSAGVTVTDPNQPSEHKADRDGAFFDAGAATAPSVVAQRAVEHSAGHAAGYGEAVTGAPTVQRAPYGSSYYDEEVSMEPMVIDVEPVYHQSSSRPSAHDEDVDMDRYDGRGHSSSRGPYGGSRQSSQAPGHGHSGSSRHSERHGVRKSSQQPASSTTTRLLAIASGVMREVHSRLHRGAANQIAAAAAAGGGLQHLLSAVRDPAYRLQPGTFQEHLGQSAAAASALGVGNCGEHAALAFCLLNKARLPEGVRIWHVSLSIDHAFVAVGRPDNPRNIVVLDAWQNNSSPKLAAEFNFPFLVNVGTPEARQFRITREARPFQPDGRDYLAYGRQTVDIEAMTQTMDTTGPAIDPRELAGQSHMWDHTMPDSADRPRPRHRHDRRQISALERYLAGGSRR